MGYKARKPGLIHGLRRSARTAAVVAGIGLAAARGAEVPKVTVPQGMAIQATRGMTPIARFSAPVTAPIKPVRIKDPFLERSPRKEEIKRVIARYSKEDGHDPRLLLAIAGHESLFDPNAVGPTEDRGLFQLTPPTIAEVAKRGVQIKNVFDPNENTRAASEYLKILGERARQRTRKVRQKGRVSFVTTKRMYLHDGKQVTFDDLPATLQRGLIIRAFNEGSSVFSENGKEAYKIARSRYVTSVMRRYDRYSTN